MPIEYWLRYGDNVQKEISSKIMSDIFSKRKRSKIMSSIKSRNTHFETSFFKILSAQIYPKGYRYRKHYSKIIGKPDVAFVKQKIAIFLDSDFWHGRNFLKLKPQLRTKFWLDKITQNMHRDKKVNRTLRKTGWRVMRFGEAELKKNPHAAVKQIEDGLRDGSGSVLI